jgi:hypothetical protein
MKLLIAVGIAASVVCFCEAICLGQMDIRSQPGGKRLLYVDNDGFIRPEPGGKRLLYIDEDILRDEPGGKRLLFVDGTDVRPEPGGIRLAVMDGRDLRRSPGGKILLNYRHPDICPTAQDKRIYFVEGPELSGPQLIGVLYLLKPDLFKLSAAEEAKLKKEMKQAGEETDKLLSSDRAPGKYMILAGSGRDGISKGNVTVSVKYGDAYHMKFEHASAPECAGVAIQREVSNDRFLWVAFGPPKTIALAVYEISGGKLEGKWYPWYYDGDAKHVGTETLTGPANLDGDFSIVAAKAPTTGAAYTGTVTIKPANIVGALDDEKPYKLTWTFGDKKILGIGIKVKNTLVVCTGTGDESFIGSLQLNNTDGMVGNWFSNKSLMGFYNTTKVN